MLALKVDIDQAAPARNGAPPSGAIPPRVQASISAVYGFRFDYPDGIAIGEALNPVTPNRIEKLFMQWKDGRADPRMLENDILLFVVVSGKFADLTSSICCCRPLYYHHRENLFCCSTSIRGLSRLGVALEAEERSVPEFLVYRYVVPPGTLYCGVNRLLGGESVRVDLASGAVVARTVFDFRQPSSASPVSSSPKELAGILREQLGATFQSHANPGVLLSGGLDSGALASLAVGLKGDVSSVSSSFAFADKSDAETEYALSFARSLPIAHHVYEGSAEAYLSGLVESIYHAEEPVHHLQSVMLYLLFRNYAHAKYDVLLCGEGADGLFGNDLHGFLHGRRRILAFARALRANVPCRLLAGAFNINHGPLQRLALDYGDEMESEHHVLWTLGRYGDPDLVRSRFGFGNEAILASHKALVRCYPGRRMLDRVTILSLLCEGSVSMYIWSKLAESQGIVMHYPFTATGVVDHATSLPWAEKLRESKYCIRSLLRQSNVSEELIVRPKLSFGFPYRHWALPGGLFQPIVDMAKEVFGAALLRSLQTEEPGHAMLLWNVLNLYLWRRLLIQEASPDELSAEIVGRYRSLSGRA